MRSWVAVPTLVLATVLLVPTGLAHIGAVETDPATTQASPFEQIACIPTCEVQMTGLSNAPPVTVVESGQTVTWSVLEGRQHTVTSDAPTQEKAGILVDGEGTPTTNKCLDVGLNPYKQGEALLRIQDGQLELLPVSEKEPIWSSCEEALALPGGSFVLSYHCNIHPRFQNSMLVVLPAQ